MKQFVFFKFENNDGIRILRDYFKDNVCLYHKSWKFIFDLNLKNFQITY